MDRRLAAILAADVVGYSRLMGEDESGTLQALRQFRAQQFEPLVAEHRGKVIKRMGDGWLVEFASIVDALTCATEVQQGLAGHDLIKLRIGIHVGDIVHEDEDIYGDGVNIAARLQEIAPVPGIAISEMAWKSLDGKHAGIFTEAGEREFKNIAEPVKVFLKRYPDGGTVEGAKPATTKKPTIAVLPLDNMSGEDAQEYFSDGVTEDIITALGKYRWFDVTARNTTFGYKGKSPDIRTLGRDLGVDYVVEGSVRKAGNRLRINIQLIDAKTGNHIWAERYDRDLDDIFAVQDEITETVVARIEPELGAVERQRVARKPRQNLQAWDCYHLGVAHFYKFTSDDNNKAQQLLKRSFELDPGFGDPYAWWAYAVILGMVYFDDDPGQESFDRALEAARKAVEIDDQSAVFHMLLGRVYLARCEYETALAELEIAIKLNPTYAAAYCGLGDSLAYEGKLDESITLFEKAIHLSPQDPQRWAFYSYGALAHIFNSDFERAVEWTRQAQLVPNCQYWAVAHMASALGHMGRIDEAREAAIQLRRRKPDFTCAFARRKMFYVKKPEQMALYLDGLRQAGVPED